MAQVEVWVWRKAPPARQAHFLPVAAGARGSESVKGNQSRRGPGSIERQAERTSSVRQEGSLWGARSTHKAEGSIYPQELQRQVVSWQGLVAYSSVLQ